MDKSKAVIKLEKYATKISTKNHELIVDEPLEMGGRNLGMNPSELMCSSLASCTAITLRMYTNRKEWSIGEIQVEVVLDNEDRDNAIFIRKIYVKGKLDETQMKRVLQIANKCPMHKILSKSNQIDTTTNLV